MTEHRGFAPCPSKPRRLAARRAAKLVWLVFCGYALTGLSCPQLSITQVLRIQDETAATAQIINQLASGINLITCNADQRRAQGSLMRDLLPYCRKIKFYQSQLDAVAQSMQSAGDSDEMKSLRSKLEDAWSSLASPDMACAAAFSNYYGCDRADAERLFAWYNSGQAEMPPLPGYEQEPRGQPPAPPPSNPGYTPPGPG